MATDIHGLFDEACLFVVDKLGWDKGDDVTVKTVTLSDEGITGMRVALDLDDNWEFVLTAEKREPTVLRRA